MVFNYLNVISRKKINGTPNRLKIIMEETIYLNTFAHRGNNYVIQIVDRSGAHFVTCTLGEEKFRDILIPEEPILDSVSIEPVC